VGGVGGGGGGVAIPDGGAIPKGAGRQGQKAKRADLSGRDEEQMGRKKPKSAACEEMESDEL